MSVSLPLAQHIPFCFPLGRFLERLKLLLLLYLGVCVLLLLPPCIQLLFVGGRVPFVACGCGWLLGSVTMRLETA